MKIGNKEVNKNEAKEILKELSGAAPVANTEVYELLKNIKKENILNIPLKKSENKTDVHNSLNQKKKAKQVKNKSFLKNELSKIDYSNLDTIADFLEVEIRKAYSNGYKQGEFELMVELIHDTSDEQRKQNVDSIRDEILKRWKTDEKR